MTGKEMIKELLKLRNWSTYKLADEAELPRTNVTGYLNRGTHDMRLDIFTELCKTMGYEVVIRDKMDNDRIVGKL